MGNRKRDRDSEDEQDGYRGASDSEEKFKKAATPKETSESKARSKAGTTKKPKFGNADDEQSPVGGESHQSSVKVLKNAEGEKYVELGKKKRAAVRSFKGQVFLDIREFYGEEGEEKPGKKGISLTKEQWEVLKRSVSVIDSCFAELGKK